MAVQGTTRQLVGQQGQSLALEALVLEPQLAFELELAMLELLERELEYLLEMKPLNSLELG